jgi:hypothetical protein
LARALAAALARVELRRFPFPVRLSVKDAPGYESLSREAVFVRRSA